MSLRTLISLLVPVLALSILTASAGSAQKPDSPEALLDRAQARLDSGDADGAMPMIERVMKRAPYRARALFLRSTAGFIRGDLEQATADLEASLAADPNQRQAWLNLGAAMMAVERWDPALDAFERARDLDPRAPDNDLNIGAVLLLSGQAAEAETHFGRYLEASPTGAEAPYQVAANYAVVGNADLAIRYLREAVIRDERTRLTIRGDPRFEYYHLDAFKHLLASDTYLPPESAHRASAAFSDRYDPRDRLLLDAVLEALPKSGLRHEPTIEATEHWALIWGDARIKISNQGDGTGLVSVSAPARAFDSAAFHRTTQRLFRTIHDRLKVLRFRR